MLIARLPAGIIRVAVFSLCSYAAAAISPKEVKSVTEGEITYFRVQVPFPADAVEGISLPSFSNPVRVPVLVSSPVFEAPCYMGVTRTDEWGSGQGSDIFYGKTKSKGPLKLRLIYPKQKAGWGEDEVVVDLAGASPLGKQTVAGEGGTTLTQEFTPAQQFARAQAEYFRYEQQVVSDDAGFFNYARLQTLRMAKLPPPSQSEFTFRGLEMPDPRDNFYDTATGARAIQESLQVDRMLRRSSASTETRTIEVSTIEGVSTKSHPFADMLKGKESKFSDLAKLVPADQYMLRFTSTAKLQELAQFVQQWGHSLLQSPEVGGANGGLRERYQKQICLPSTLLSRVLGPAVVKEMVMTGSDPFFREGTDLTVIFDTISADLFKAAVDQHWNAAAAEPGVSKKSETISGASVESLVSADRSICAWRTTVGNLVVYSNSRAALQRILDTKAKPETSLASAEDFRYMRAVWPQNPAEEDGFLYLSDAFIRRLVGPATKIKEKRRLEAYGSMRMILNAAMLNGYLNGPGKVPSLEEMVKAGLLDKADLAGAEGELTWNPESAVVSNSIYGSPQIMTPLSDLPIDKVSKSESDEYVRFRDRYQEYWRRYFDPIGIRIKVGQTVSLEAYILPLIDETHYQDLKRLTGSKPAKLDLSQITTATLGRWQVSLDMESREVRDARQMVGSMFGRDSQLTDWVGKWGTVWLEDSSRANKLFDWFFDAADRDIEEPVEPGRETLTSFFQLPLALGVDVKNNLGLAAFLVAMQGMVRSAAPDLVKFIPLDPYNGVTFVKVSPLPNGPIARELRNDARHSGNQDETKAADDKQTTVPDVGLYYGNIGSAFYISTQKSVLEHLVDTSQEQNTTGGRVIEYNAFLAANPGNAVQARPLVEKATATVSRMAERATLRQAWLLFRCGTAASSDDLASAARKWFGGELSLPSGGKTSYDAATDQAVSSVWGPMRQLKSPSEVPTNPMLQLIDSIPKLRAWLRFTEDGLISKVELERASKE